MVCGVGKGKLAVSQTDKLRLDFRRYSHLSDIILLKTHITAILQFLESGYTFEHSDFIFGFSRQFYIKIRCQILLVPTLLNICEAVLLVVRRYPLPIHGM